jgi:membrane-associated HD superfamily phosphohydrolase
MVLNFDISVFKKRLSNIYHARIAYPERI